MHELGREETEERELTHLNILEKLNLTRFYRDRELERWIAYSMKLTFPLNKLKLISASMGLISTWG